MKNTKLITAFLLLGIGIEELVRWFIITSKNISFDAMKIEYAKALPGFLQNSTVHTLIVMGCFIGAALLFLDLKNQPKLKLFSKISAAISFVLAFWMLFSLM